MSKEIQHIDRLATGIKRGDSISFQKLYEQMSGKILHYAYSFVLSHEEAEEIMHDVFLRIWDKRASLDTDKSLSAFMLTITKNLTLDRIRKYSLETDKLREYFREDQQKPQDSAEQRYLYQELDKTIEEIINSMPPRRQKVYQLSRKNGMTNREISEYLNITTIAVEKHIRLALDTLRSELNKKKWPLLLIFLHIAHQIFQ